MDKVHKIAIVVDKKISKEKILSIVNNMHVWLIESESNLKNVRAIYEQNNFSADDLLDDGITTFQNVEDGASPIDILDSIIDEVSEHHNEYSHPPGWSKLYVYGIPIDGKITAILQEFGFFDFQVIDTHNFVAIRPTP